MQYNYESESISKTARREHSWEINETQAKINDMNESVSPTKAQGKHLANTVLHMDIAINFIRKGGGAQCRRVSSRIILSTSLYLIALSPPASSKGVATAEVSPIFLFLLSFSAHSISYLPTLSNTYPLFLSISLMVTLWYPFHQIWPHTLHNVILLHSNENVKNIWIPHFTPSITTQSTATVTSYYHTKIVIQIFFTFSNPSWHITFNLFQMHIHDYSATLNVRVSDAYDWVGCIM